MSEIQKRYLQISAPLALLLLPGLAYGVTIKPDGSGDFKTIQAAIDAVPATNTQPQSIELAPGLYKEALTIPKGKEFITLKGLGETRDKVIITAGATQSTLTADADNLHVQNLTLENSAGATAGPNQALTSNGDKQVYENVRFVGWQDTMYLRAAKVRQYFRNCEVLGSVDFIYGSACAVFENCDIIQQRFTGGPLTAPSTPQEQPYGLVFLNCRLLRGPAAKAGSVTLMRPWREYGMSAFINCTMDDGVSPKGWSEWSGREATCRAFEYGSKTLQGQPVDPGQRAPWSKRLSADEAAKYTVSQIFGDWAPVVAGVAP